jgi:hypothetical protein
MLLRAIDLPDGDQHVRVRAIDARGLEGLNADRAFTLSARPEPPLLSQPASVAGACPGAGGDASGRDVLPRLRGGAALSAPASSAPPLRRCLSAASSR